MTTFTQPLAAPQALTRPLGETTCVVTAGPWLSAMAGQAFAAAGEPPGFHEAAAEVFRRG